MFITIYIVVMLKFKILKNESGHDKTNTMTSWSIKDSDQFGHLLSLIRNSK